MNRKIYFNGFMKSKNEIKKTLIAADEDTGLIEYILYEENDINKLLTNLSIDTNTVLYKFDDSFLIQAGDFNAHSHPEQSLYTDITDKSWDLPQWCRNTIYKYSPILTPEQIYLGCRRAFSSMLSYGVTSVMVSFYCHGNKGNIFDKKVMEAAADTGIRLYFGRMNYDIINEEAYEAKVLSQKSYFETPEEAEENFLALLKEINHPNIEIAPSVHSMHASTKEAIIKAINLGNKFNKLVQFHLSEDKGDVELCLKLYGVRPIEFLSNLAKNGDVESLSCLMLSDCVWIDDNERQLIKEHNIKVVLNPRMNNRIKTGDADLLKLLSLDICPYLGTDGEASNDDLSIYGEYEFLKSRFPELTSKELHNIGSLPISFKTGFISKTLVPGAFCDLKITEDNELKHVFVGAKEVDCSQRNTALNIL